MDQSKIGNDLQHTGKGIGPATEGWLGQLLAGTKNVGGGSVCAALPVHGYVCSECCVYQMCVSVCVHTTPGWVKISLLQGSIKIT